jgi:predicted nucleotidyltransferase
MNQETLIYGIVDTLKSKINPYRIYLFGSYATGKNILDSDIDLLVVTNDNFIPSSYVELTKIRLRVSKAIENFRYKVPIDIIVHTKPMNDIFFLQQSAMSKQISEKGILLYEAGNA